MSARDNTERNESAFDALFRAWYPRLVGFAESLGVAPADAEDVVVEVFQRIWAQYAEWDPRGPVGAYLFRAVRNETVTLQRRTRRAADRDTGLTAAGEFPGIATAPVPPDAALEANELQQQIWAAIDAMPTTRRAAAHLRWREGMDYTDIARILGTTSAAVQMQVSRALSTLRAMLGPASGNAKP